VELSEFHNPSFKVDDDENGHADFAETVWGSWSHQIISPFSKCNHELFEVAFSILELDYH